MISSNLQNSVYSEIANPYWKGFYVKSNQCVFLQNHVEIVNKKRKVKQHHLYTYDLDTHHLSEVVMPVDTDFTDLILLPSNTDTINLVKWNKKEIILYKALFQ